MISEMPDVEETPDEVFIKKEEIEKLHEALDKLPEKQRMILQFKYFYEMSNNEIADLFDIDQKNIQMYILRAKKMLRKIIDEESVLYGSE